MEFRASIIYHVVVAFESVRTIIVIIITDDDRQAATITADADYFLSFHLSLIGLFPFSLIMATVVAFSPVA